MHRIHRRLRPWVASKFRARLHLYRAGSVKARMAALGTVHAHAVRRLFSIIGIQRIANRRRGRNDAEGARGHLEDRESLRG